MKFLNKLSSSKLEANFMIYLFGKIVSAGVALSSIPIFMKAFGVEKYGQFIFLYTTFLMIISGSSGWIVQGVLRFYSLEKNKSKIRTESLQMASNSLCVFVLVLTAIFVLYKASLTVLLIAILALITSVFYAINLAFEQSKINSKKVVVAEIVRTILFLATPIALNFLFKNLTELSCLFLGILISYICGYLYLTKGKPRIPYPNFRKSRWNIIFLKYGLPLSVWLILSPTTNGVDRYVIEITLGSIALAKFTAIFDIIFKLFSNLLVPLNNVVQPMLVNSYNNKDFLLYKKTMIKSFIYITLVFLIFLIAIFILSDFILCDYLQFCEEKKTLSRLLFPLIACSYIWQLSVLLQKNMEVSNRTIEMTTYMLLVSLIIVVLGLILVPKYGLIASAYVGLTGAFIYLLLIIKGTLKRFKI